MKTTPLARLLTALCLLEQPGRAAVGGFLWATAYGFGFGAGLGFAFHFCQEEIRARLQASPPAQPKA